jgi:hypothetical protein
MGSTYKFAKARAMEVLEDVEETVGEQGVVLDELLGDLAWGQGTAWRARRRGAGSAKLRWLERRGVLLVLLYCCELINAVRGPVASNRDGELASVWSVCTGLRGPWRLERHACDRR